MGNGLSSKNHRFKLYLGKMLNRLPLNRVIRKQTPAGILFYKTRRWYSNPLVYASTLLDKPFTILAQPDWYMREQQIHRQIYGEDIFLDANGYLVMPARPGEQLSSVLDNTSHDQQTKLQALDRAIGALWELHQQVVVEKSGVYRLFSHADAIVDNVTYDAATDKAWWFDFETTHPADRSLPWRRADDLRALAYSAAAHFPLLAIAPLAKLVVAIYPDPKALDQLARIATSLQRSPGIIHLGQTHIDYQRSQILNQTFQQIIHFE